MAKTRKAMKNTYSRINTNRPPEVSSKLPLRKRQHKLHFSPFESRDPRFDALCGEFDKSVWRIGDRKSFEKNYNFVKTLKRNEIRTIRERLGNPELSIEERDWIKFYLQREENQRRELKKVIRQSSLLNEKRCFEISRLKEGINPFRQKKANQKLLQLTEQFEEVRKRGFGSINKLMKRLRKKKATKDRMTLNFPV